MSNPDIKLEASLDVSTSRKKIKEDVKKLGNINVPLTGKLNMQKTRAQIKKQTSGKNLGTVNLNTNINTKNITSSVSKATSQAQKQMSAKPLTFSINKDKLINDIKILGQQNSRLFKDVGMTTKYNQLLDSAKLATSTKDLKILRMSLSAFKSELKATGNAGLTMGDALKKGLTRATELFGSYGLIMMFSRQLRNAWTEARELDASLTDLEKVNDEITRSDFPEYLEKCISKTKELAVATKDYIEAVTTFSRAGYNLADSEILAEKATQLANVGDMSAEDASKTILSGIQAYNEIDGYGIEQLEEKAQALNDKLNEIGNTASISTSELAEGIQAVGSVMNDANTSIDEFIALLGAGNRQVQDSKKVSLAIRTSALRIRSCTTELEEMGEETEGVITSTSELADKIKALTDIDGVGKLEGVSILEDDGKTFRSIFDIYNDISKVYDKMDDTDSSALLKLIAGTHRSSQVSAILNNMAEANEILNNSLNATGSASEEYSKYLESAEAATTRFGVAMTDAYNSVLNGNTVKALANTGTAILDFANEFGLVESTLRGLIAIGILKGIGTLTTAIKGSVVQVTNLGNALNTVKNLNNLTRGTQQYANAMNMLKVSCVGLTDAQLKQVLSNTSLTQSERIKILQYQGLTKAQAQAKLTQLGLTQTTNQQTTANTMATTSTLSLKNAVTGLGASIKASLLSNPIGWIIMGISTAISIATSAISNYNQELEEQKQKSQELTQAWQEENDTIDETISKYKELKESIESETLSTEEITSAKEDLASIEDTLVEKYGTEALNIDLVNGKYEEQLATLKELSKEKARQFVAENGKSVKSDIEYLEDDFYSSTNLAISKAGATAEEAIGFDLSKILENYSNLSIDSHLNGMTSQRTFRLDANGTREETYNQLVGLYNDLKERYGSENKNVNSVLDKITSLLNSYYDKDEIDAAKERVKSYAEADILSQNDTRALYDDATKAVEEYNEALASGKGVEEAKANLETVQGKVDDAFGENGILGDIHGAEDVFNDLWESISSGATETEESVKKLFSSFEGSEIGERLQYLTQQFKDGELTYKEYFDALQSEIDNVDFSNYTDSLDEANKAAQQFFTDSIQQTATGLSDLISKFDEGSIGITEYLEGYVSIAETLSSLTDNLQENSASWDKNGEAIDNATSKALDETQSKLDSAISTIASYQDSIYSLEQIMTQSVEVGSDEFNAHAQVIAQDLYNIVQAGGLMADEISNTLGTTTSQIAKSLTENVSNQSLAAQAISANTNTAITNMATAVGELFDSLGDAISNFKVDVTFGVKSITTKTADLGLLGKVQLPAIKFGIEADGESLSAIGDAVSSFGKSVASNFTPQTIDINDYLFGNTETGKNSSYTPSGDILNNYNNALDKIKKSGKGTSQVFDWIENKLKSVQRTITNLGKTVSATWKSWITRNNALAQQISEVNKEITLQQQAYQKYMALANGVGLSSYYQNLVKSGTIDISTITNEDLIDQIKAFEDFYNKALDCQDAIVDLEDELANLAKTKFDNVASEYENQLSMIEHKTNVIESSIDILESKGYMVSSQAYDALINIENETLNSLQNKYNALAKTLEEAMAVGKIQKMSDEWCSMQLEIYKVQEAILESKNALVEYNNTLRDLEWEVFDKLQSKISSITSESDFLIELMSDEKMFDDGKITEHGQATLGLHALNYQTYLAQAKEYASELAQIEEELAKDQYNQDLIERKSELIKLQQDSILASESELDAIKSLKQEGYDALLDSMSKFIQKQKDMLSNISDMYNYQKNISELTANVSQYEKMLKSVQGMSDTESGKKLIQEYSVKLKEAQDNLEETEREKTISDIEQLLDALESNTEEWANSRLDNLDEIIQEAIAQTEANADSILKTLETETTKVGTTLTTEMESIWGSNGTFTTVMNNVVDMFKNYFDSVQKASAAELNKTVANATSGSSSSGSSSSSSASANTTSNTSTNTSSSSSGWGSWFVSKTYAKQNLNPETSIVDRLKSKNINADFSYRSQYYRAMGGSGVYTGSASQNRWMLSQMKAHGFAQGGTIGNLIKATGEDGFVLARTGEGILTPENMKMLENVMITMNPVVDSLAKLPSLPDMRKQNGDMQVTFGDIQMYGVNDPVEFEKQLLHHMKNSRPIRKVMKDTTIGEALGKNPMIRYTR